jgi:hypothetical protein
MFSSARHDLSRSVAMIAPDVSESRLQLDRLSHSLVGSSDFNTRQERYGGGGGSPAFGHQARSSGGGGDGGGGGGVGGGGGFFYRPTAGGGNDGGGRLSPPLGAALVVPRLAPHGDAGFSNSLHNGTGATIGVAGGRSEIEGPPRSIRGFESDGGGGGDRDRHMPPRIEGAGGGGYSAGTGPHGGGAFSSGEDRAANSASTGFGR